MESGEYSHSCVVGSHMWRIGIDESKGWNDSNTAHHSMTNKLIHAFCKLVVCRKKPESPAEWAQISQGTLRPGMIKLLAYEAEEVCWCVRVDEAGYW